MMKAAIDIGTNSVRLLIGDWKDGSFKAIRRELTITRLGQGVDNSGKLSPDAMSKTVRAIENFAQILEQENPEQVHVIATSAVRDAINRKEFISLIKERTGLTVRVLTGEEEARLSFKGAVETLYPKGKNIGLLGVLDIGGGSTELMFGDSSGAIAAINSVQVGAVRMTERYISSNPIKKEELLNFEKAARTELRKLVKGFDQSIELIGVGGTITTAAAMEQRMFNYSAEQVTGVVLRDENLQLLYHQLAAMSLEERLNIPGLQRGREDVIVAGLGILIIMMDLLNCHELTVSDGDLLLGVLLEKTI